MAGTQNSKHGNIYAGVDFPTSRVAKLAMVLSGRTKQAGLKVEVQHKLTDTT